MLVRIGINVILAVSLNLIIGFTGLFSIGHAGFMAIGAYASAAVSVYGGPALHAALDPAHRARRCADGILLAFALAVGSSSAAVAGALVGIPTLRLKSDYLAIATLGFGEIIRVVILNLDFVGGARGFTGIPALAGFFWVYLVRRRDGRHRASHRAVGNGVWRSSRFARTISPRTSWASTRPAIKVTAFLVGSFFAGIAGGLFAHFDAYLHTNSFTFMRSIEIIVMVVLGGMGSISGSVASAALLTVAAGSAARRRGIPHGDLLGDADRVDAHAPPGNARRPRDRPAAAARAA